MGAPIIALAGAASGILQGVGNMMSGSGSMSDMDHWRRNYHARRGLEDMLTVTPKVTGIHPLALLGQQAYNPSPITHVPKNNVLAGLADMGQSAIRGFMLKEQMRQGEAEVALKGSMSNYYDAMAKNALNSSQRGQDQNYDEIGMPTSKETKGYKITTNEIPSVTYMGVTAGYRAMFDPYTGPTGVISLMPSKDVSETLESYKPARVRFYEEVKELNKKFIGASRNRTKANYKLMKKWQAIFQKNLPKNMKAIYDINRFAWIVVSKKDRNDLYRSKDTKIQFRKEARGRRKAREAFNPLFDVMQ